jgi:hypothetical protein
MRGRYLPMGLLWVWLAGGIFESAAVDAGEQWMFRRSYFSHALPPEAPPEHPLPESRSAYRTAYYREAFGGSIRSAYRINNYVIQSGPRSDRTFYREGYIEFEP